MLKVGLIGIGFMGRVHLDNYIRLESEGFPIRLKAICDLDEKKFKGIFVDGNMEVGKGNYDFSRYDLYTSFEEMLMDEELDFIDICLPTYLHAEATVKALNRGNHVLCEKPMALNTYECGQMIDAAKRNDRLLMVAQCLRFWPEYEYLKECVEGEKHGKVMSAYFFRGGNPPIWSYQNWMLKEQLSGGSILDLHIHDVDMIQWLFGKPKRVSTLGKNVFMDSGYDIVSSHYDYNDGKVINAQADWSLRGDFGFEMTYRVNFEQGNLVFQNGVLRENPRERKGFSPDITKDNGYYREIKYFANSIMNNTPIVKADPWDTLTSIQIVEAEKISADNSGKIIEL